MKSYTLTIIVALSALTAACSGQLPTSSSPTATGAGTQNIFTNAPGGIPVDVPPSPDSCPSVIPSVRAESDWPKSNHFSFDWGHNPAAVQVEIVITRRETSPAYTITLKPNEHTAGSGAVSHHTEQDRQTGIYDIGMTYIYPFCRSRTVTFSLNHGMGFGSIPNPTPGITPPS